MRQVVLDTSALVRLYVPDGPLPEGLEAVIESGWRGDSLLLVPELLLVEFVQVIRKKEARGWLSLEEGARILAAVLDLPLEVIGHRDLVPLALRLSRELGITAYDATFIALSIHRGAALLSADEAMLEAHTRACGLSRP
jgi:predicted nucleic acid-binding protein